MLIRAHQIVQFFGEILVFPKNNGALLKYLKGIFITSLVLPNYIQKKLFLQTKFFINHVGHLKMTKKGGYDLYLD